MKNPNMKKTVTPHIIFPDLRTLLLAWHHCLKNGGEEKPALFPPSVLQTAAWEWAAPKESLINFNHLATQHRWQWRGEQDKPEGVEVALKSCIAGFWEYRDPLRSARRGQNQNDPPVTRYAPFDHEREYLLAARDEAEAAHLLHVLTEFVVQGIRAVPLVLTGGDEFEFFWMVTSEQPPLAAMSAAARAWWGPIGAGPTRIYKQWPFDLEIADVLLHRIPWGAPEGFTLLSKDSPHVLTLRRAGDGQIERELIEVVTLRAGDLSEASAASPPLPGKFEVKLKLRERPERYKLAESIKQLERDIETKRRRLERLSEEILIEGKAHDALPQPLLLYYPDEDRPKSVPYQLQRLLIEWTGQTAKGYPADLESLRYLKLGTESFPQGLDNHFPEVHVLTTAAALDKRKGIPDAGLKLLDYRPEASARVWFDLLPEWAEHHLCLFVPHELRLSLYPQFRPGDFAAEKLGRALLGQPGYREYALLLVPTPKGEISACRIRKDQFRPLVEVVEWECGLETEPYDPRIIEDKIEERRDRFVSELENSLYLAVKGLAMARLSRKDQQLREKLKEETAERERRREAIDRLHEELEGFDQLCVEVESVMSGLRREQERLGDKITSSQKNAADLHSLALGHERLLRKLADAERKLRESQDRLRRWRERDPTNGAGAKRQ